MNIGILAGEASGDRLGSGLIEELRKVNPDLTVSGIGGPLMIKAGCESLYEMERLSIMGFFEPLRRLPELLKIRRGVIQHFLQNPPDVFIGIDSPDFNLGIELKLRKANIPVIHYVSPSVWAWRQNRIKKIAKATNLVLTLFPFEADFYQKHQVPVAYVGHPLADLIPLQPDVMAARRALQLDENAEYLALLPGSRRNELKQMAELFIQAAKKCIEQKPQLKIITSSINAMRDEEFKAICHRIDPNFPITFFVNRTHDVMAAANVVLVTSGTATLETMLFKRPMVIAYRVGALTFQIAKRVINVKHIGLPNLLASEKCVPEFIQDAATPEAIAEAILKWLNDSELAKQLSKKFFDIHNHLRRNANQEAATAVRRLLGYE